MKERFLLSTYVISITNNKKDEQLLDKFNQKDDFLLFLKKYLDFLFENPQKKSSEVNNSTQLHLTLTAPAKIDLENRAIYGTFQGGVSGTDLTIKDLESNADLLKVRKDKHGSFREVFFYFKLPKTSKKGYLVVQRLGKYGVKGIIDETINKYLKEKGYVDCRFYLKNVIHGKVFKKMLKEGNLKRVEFIKKIIPKTFEGFLSDENSETEKGILSTSIQSHTSLGDSWKGFVDKTMGTFRDNRTRIEIKEKEFDEIEFQLELNGKKKTFYANCQQRVQPDVDVSADLIYENEIPSITSIIEKAEELIYDIIEIRPNV